MCYFVCSIRFEAEQLQNLCKQITARVEMFAGFYPAFLFAQPKETFGFQTLSGSPLACICLDRLLPSLVFPILGKTWGWLGREVKVAWHLLCPKQTFFFPPPLYQKTLLSFYIVSYIAFSKVLYSSKDTNTFTKHLLMHNWVIEEKVS